MQNLFFFDFYSDYLIILVFFGFLLVIAIILFLFSFFVVEQHGGLEKNSMYECGFQPFEETRTQFDVRYYLVGILFIIFDLEIMFLLPWVICASLLQNIGILSMVVFLLILGVGFIVECSSGALDWD